MSLSWGEADVALQLSADWAARYRRVFGFIGDMKLPPADTQRGAESPPLFQIIAQLPFRYGNSNAESSDSWIHCRISAFVTAACFGTAPQILRVGDAVTGFIESTNSKAHDGAQLTGWRKIPAVEWKAMSKASFPAVFETNRNFLSALSQLSRRNFSISF